MPPEPPKDITASKCDRSDRVQEPAGDEAPTCCWHHYMEYWLQRMADEEAGESAAGDDKQDNETP